MARYARIRNLLWMAIPLAILLVIAVACGGDDATPTTALTATSIAPTATTAPGGAAPTPTEVPVSPPTPTGALIAGTGRIFTNTPTPIPGAAPTATSVTPPVDDFKVGDRRLSGGVIEIKYGEPQYGGRMPVQALSPINQWDPHGDPSIDAPRSSPMTNSLLQFNPWTFDRYDIWGDLAESWRQMKSDGTEWEFTLKPHAVWWDGTPVTAEDVVFSFARMTGNLPNHTTEGGLARDPKNYVRPNYDHAEAIDERTVRIFLNAPWADFLGYMSNDLIMILPKHHYEVLDAQFQDDPNVFDGDDAWTRVMGSGPFKPSYVNNVDEWGYDTSPNYWKLDPEGRSLPYLDGMDYFKITDRTAAQAAFEADQLWETNYQTNGNMSPGTMREMIERFGDKFVAYPAACCPSGVAMNVTRPPFSDPKVRKAMMLAIDRQAHNELVWGGLGVFGTFCGPPGHPLCMTEAEVLALPGWRQPKDQDWAEARRLMADAGFPDGFETTYITRNILAFQDEGPVLEDTLRTNLNIRVENITLDRASADQARADGDYDLVHTVSGAGVITPDQYLNRFFLLTNDLNPFDWRYDGPAIGEPEADLHELIREQSRTLDPVARKNILMQIEEIYLTKDTHVIMNYTQTFARFFNTEKVGGQQPTQSGYIETKAEQLWLLNP